jgi:uridine phosphorylase
MNASEGCPLFDHALNSPSAFKPEEVVNSVREARGLPELSVPAVCVFDFDGDLTDWLSSHGMATPFVPWACFHTTMYVVEAEGIRCGLIARTIGGPYAVLIAEQLRATGARLILGLTSAGRVSPSFPLPGLVVVTCAVRDEGTSLHYLPPGEDVACPTPIGNLLSDELIGLGWTVVQGSAWTTDAPYRETIEQLQRHADAGVLAVEMQAASLFAFATARQVNIGIVAHVTNALDHQDEQFNKGSDEDSFNIMRAMLRAGRRYLELPPVSVEQQRIVRFELPVQE